MTRPRRPAPPWQQARDALHRRTAHLPPTVRGLLWSAAAGLIFSVLNALMRALALHLDPFQAQFLRYMFGLLVLLPLVAHSRSLRAWWPRSVRGQFIRGALHTAGLVLWFWALPRIPLADMTAIGFTGPLFIMVGAWLFFKEPMHWERWVAVALGFAGVLIVVGPKLSIGHGGGGLWHLVMLGSAPLFAASFLVTKALTRYETAGTILLWQAITVTLLSLPLAVPGWQAPTPWQWAGFLACGVLGSAGHYCLTRSYQVADISSTQSAKFLDLLWSALMGWFLFSDLPTASTLLGGVVIATATLWVARREARRRPTN